MTSQSGMNLYKLLIVLEQKNNLFWLDGLHRQILFAVMTAKLAISTLSSQQISYMHLTSRSSTYRKIAELKERGFLQENWQENKCFIKFGYAAHTFFKEAEGVFAELKI